MARVAACDPRPRPARHAADDGLEVEDEAEDPRPAVVDAELAADELVHERRERLLHVVGDLLLVGELPIE